jgi:hypothetical protein
VVVFASSLSAVHVSQSHAVMIYFGCDCMNIVFTTACVTHFDLISCIRLDQKVYAAIDDNNFEKNCTGIGIEISICSQTTACCLNCIYINHNTSM